MIINNSTLSFFENINLKWLCLVLFCYSGQWSFATSNIDNMMVNVFCNVLTDATTSTSMDGSVQISINSGVPPYEMLVLNANNEIMEEQTFNTDINFALNEISAGSYLLNVRDNTGEQNNCEFTIAALTCDLIAEVNNVEVDCFGDVGALAVTASEGVPPYTYEWDTGETSSTIEDLITGEYAVTVTDDANCFIEISGQIISPSAVLVFCEGTTPTSSITSEDGSGLIGITGGLAPYSFIITDRNNEEILESSSTILGTNFSVNGLAAGMYQVQLEDANGCAATCTFTIGLQNCDLTVELEDVLLSCFNEIISLEPNVSGGLSPYVFQWEGGATTSTLPNIGVGIYEVTVTDNAGCIIATSATITQPTALNATCSVVQNVSTTGGRNGAVQIHIEGATPPYQFDLSDMTTLSILDGTIQGASTFIADNLSASDYQLSVIDAQACSSVCLFQITEPQCAMTVQVADSDVPCQGDLGGLSTVVSGGTPPYQYFWTNGTSLSSVSDLPAGDYSVSVTDNTGCRVIETANIIEPELLEVACSILHQGSITGAATGQIEAFITGGTAPYTYELNSGQNGTSNQEGAALLDGLIANDYVLMITDENGCTADCSFSIFPCAMEVSSTSTNVSCFGGSDGRIEIHVTGAVGLLEYDWNIDDLDGQSSVQNLPAGTYQVTVRDANNCIITRTITISQSTEGFDLTCDLQSSLENSIFTYSIVEGIAPYQILIQSDNFELEQEQNMSGTFSVNVPTEDVMYQITVTDANGCTKSCVTTLIPEGCNTLVLAPHYQGSFDCGLTPGFGTAFVIGGTPPYQFFWSNGINNQYNNELIPSQTYGVSVVDATGCFAEKSITIPTSSELSVEIEVISSSNNETVTLVAHITGGLPPYYFDWSTGSSAAQLYDVEPGIYSLIVRDFNFCTAIASINVDNITHTPNRIIPNLEARKKEELGILYWTVEPEEEEDILFYNLEKKLADDDGFSSMVQFEKENSAQNFYTYHDEKLQGGDNFYRLKVHYTDGIYEFSDIKRLHFNKDINDLTLFPNPARDEIKIIFPVSTEEEVQVDIYNHLGQLVKQENVLVQPHQALRFSVEQFTNGLYYISVQLSRGKRLTKKLVIENLN